MSQVNTVSIEGNIVKEITFNEKGNATLYIVQNQYRKNKVTEEWEESKSDLFPIKIFKESIIADLKEQLTTGKTVVAQCRLSTFTPKDSKYSQITLILKSLEIKEREVPATEEPAAPAPAEEPKKAKRGRPAGSKNKKSKS